MNMHSKPEQHSELTMQAAPPPLQSSSKSTATFACALRFMDKTTFAGGPDESCAATGSAIHPGVVAGALAHDVSNASPLNVTSPVGRRFIDSTVDCPGMTSNNCWTVRLPCAVMLMQSTSAGACMIAI
jgi:hypothetical protein